MDPPKKNQRKAAVLAKQKISNRAAKKNGQKERVERLRNKKTTAGPKKAHTANNGQRKTRAAKYAVAKEGALEEWNKKRKVRFGDSNDNDAATLASTASSNEKSVMFDERITFSQLEKHWEQQEHQRRREQRQIHSDRQMVLSRRTSWNIHNDDPSVMFSPIRAEMLHFSPEFQFSVDTSYEFD